MSKTVALIFVLLLTLLVCLPRLRSRTVTQPCASKSETTHVSARSAATQPPQPPQPLYPPAPTFQVPTNPSASPFQEHDAFVTQDQNQNITFYKLTQLWNVFETRLKQTEDAITAMQDRTLQHINASVGGLQTYVQDNAVLHNGFAGIPVAKYTDYWNQIAADFQRLDNIGNTPVAQQTDAVLKADQSGTNYYTELKKQHPTPYVRIGGFPDRNRNTDQDADPNRIDPSQKPTTSEYDFVTTGAKTGSGHDVWHRRPLCIGSDDRWKHHNCAGEKEGMDEYVNPRGKTNFSHRVSFRFMPKGYAFKNQ